MVLARRHALTVYAAMFAMFVIGVAITLPSEQHGSRCSETPASTSECHDQSGGNMEDKEIRFGLAKTGVLAMGTTNTSNGAVDWGHDSLTPSVVRSHSWTYSSAR